MVVANAIIAGVIKSGTTSAFQYFVDHEDVLLSKTKETCFFLPAADRDPPTLSKEEYSRFFPNYNGETCVLEATPGYFYGKEPLIEEIKRICGQPKIIIILREPVARTLSYFNFMKSMLYIPADLDFKSYVDASIEKQEIILKQMEPYAGVLFSQYSDFMQPWIDAFGSDLKVYFFDDLKTRRNEVIESMCNHIGVPRPSYNLDEIPVQNMTRSHGNNIIHYIALWVNRKTEPFFRTRPALKSKIIQLYYVVNGEGKRKKRPAADDDTKNKLNEYFAPYNERLKKMLLEFDSSIELPSWIR